MNQNTPYKASVKLKDSSPDVSVIEFSCLMSVGITDDQKLVVEQYLAMCEYDLLDKTDLVSV